MVLTVRVSSKYYIIINHTLPGTITAVQSVATPTSFYHSVPDKCTRAVNHFLPYWALALCIGHLECVKIELNRCKSIIMGMALARYAYVHKCTLYNIMEYVCMTFRQSTRYTRKEQS